MDPVNTLTWKSVKVIEENMRESPSLDLTPKRPATKAKGDQEAASKCLSVQQRKQQGGRHPAECERGLAKQQVLDMGLVTKTHEESRQLCSQD